MEPVSSLVVGVAGNFVADGLQRGYGALSADDFRGCFDSAAKRTATEYGLDTDDFDALFHSDLPAEDLDAFEQKVEQTARRDFAARLRTATDSDLVDAEAVVDAFVRNIELEIAATDAEHGLRLLLEYAQEFIEVQRQRERFRDVFKAELRTLEMSVEVAHDETQSHVADEHDETRAYLETVIREVEGGVSDSRTTNPHLEGFQQLSSVDFEATRDVKRCWRIGFDFADVRAGYAFERRSRDDESETVVDDLRARLLAGDDVVVLGRPGSGKSTTCKQWRVAGMSTRTAPYSTATATSHSARQTVMQSMFGWACLVNAH
ncbi:hypothetical protein [Haladaptatus cibarius]|uniref:hypothetical protein n=1 Tax=Haladaptatus cibarius TaxID=453847 RepID=UPI0006788744|nr:hypothetical protein [Haladaptatus cibarius]